MDMGLLMHLLQHMVCLHVHPSRDQQAYPETSLKIRIGDRIHSLGTSEGRGRSGIGGRGCGHLDIARALASNMAGLVTPKASTSLPKIFTFFWHKMRILPSSFDLDRGF